MGGLETSYGALATAAGNGDPGGYTTAREAIAGAEDDARGALQALERAGYEVAGP
jgi:hypothetical protein